MNVSYSGKVQFNTFISEDTVRRFKEMVAKKWNTYSKGLISAEVDQALRHYISLGGIISSGENRDHTHTIDQQNNTHTIHRRKVVKPTRPVEFTKKEVDQLSTTLAVVGTFVDKRSKGLKIERDEKELIKASRLKEEIIQFLIDTKKFESREAIKTVPKTLLKNAITAILNIEDSRSINNKINYLRTYNQINDIIGTRQYRINL